MHCLPTFNLSDRRQPNSRHMRAEVYFDASVCVRARLVVFRANLFFYFYYCCHQKKWSSDERGENRWQQRACVPQSGPQNLPPSKEEDNTPDSKLTGNRRATDRQRETETLKCFLFFFIYISFSQVFCSVWGHFLSQINSLSKRWGGEVGAIRVLTVVSTCCWDTHYFMLVCWHCSQNNNSKFVASNDVHVDIKWTVSTSPNSLHICFAQTKKYLVMKCTAHLTEWPR